MKKQKITEMTDLTEKIASPIEDNGKLLPEITTMSQDQDMPEGRPYVISFAQYKDKLCEISFLQKSNAKKALNVLKNIGTKVCSKTDFNKNNLKIKKIINNGEYKRLYNSLSPDTEISEITLSDTSRIFYYDIESEKTLYIIAIKENHFETDKNR